jgi:hypothetical protein
MSTKRFNVQNAGGNAADMQLPLPPLPSLNKEDTKIPNMSIRGVGIGEVGDEES